MAAVLVIDPMVRVRLHYGNGIHRFQRHRLGVEDASSRWPASCFAFGRFPFGIGRETTGVRTARLKNKRL